MLRPHVIKAVFLRNFWSYFSGMIGYLVIVVFVMLSGFAQFQGTFFNLNQANLDQLNQWFPQLLLFIVPAITMSLWADERKLGTDELMFTLPVSDTEVLIGKYLAAVGVYTVTLLFSITHCIILFMIGNPDPWQLAANYFGFWLAGSALLSAGMLASYFTNSTTVAFVWGIVLCLPFVLVRQMPVPAILQNLVPAGFSMEQLGVPYHFRPFGLGVVKLSSVVYFVSLAVIMLYINRVLIGYRHWSTGRAGSTLSWQLVVRAVSLAVVLFSLNVIAMGHDRSLDATSERLYTITPTTRKTLKDINPERPVTIQVFVSRELPRDYIPVRTALLGLLDQYSQVAGGKLNVRVVTIDPFDEKADEAKNFGIESRRIASERDGRQETNDVFLGVVVSAAANEVVIPFVDVGLPIEYELTRSIQTVSEVKRKRIGILETAAKIGGGFDMGAMRQLPEWRIVTELKKQYDVETITADKLNQEETAKPDPADKDGKSAEEKKEFDCVIAVLPSSLNANDMNHFVDYVRKGKPVLIFDDPLPAFNPELAPRQPTPRTGGMFGGGGPSEPKADGGKATRLVNLLGIQWKYDEVIFDNAFSIVHPEFMSIVRPEMIDITTQNGIKDPFDPQSPVTSNLQELLVFFSGEVRKIDKAHTKVTPLMRTGIDSGVIPWDKLVRPGSPFGGGISINPNPPYVKDDYAHIIAVQVEPGTGEGAEKVNAIYVADSDIIADWFFEVRERNLYNLRLDNITFVLNAVDTLAGEKSFIDLRKRRAKARTLIAVENQTKRFVQERAKETQLANEDAEKALTAAKDRLSATVKKLRDDKTLDDATKLQMLAIAEENEQRRVEVESAKVENAKQKKVEESQRQMNRQINAVQSRFSIWAQVLAPIPPIILGLIVLLIRMSNEQRDVAPTRRVS